MLLPKLQKKSKCQGRHTNMNARHVVFAFLLFAVSATAHAAQGVGQGCSAFKPCGDGLHCMPFRQVCHRNSGALDGEACQAGYGCASGYTCEAGSQVCRGPGKTGDSCHATKPCGSGLSCQPGVQKCYHTPRQLGEPCVAGYTCGDKLKCQAGTQVCISSVHPTPQCVFNQSRYVAQIKWFADGTMKSTKTGDKAYSISATKPAFKTETIPLAQKSCVGGEGSKNWAVLTIKGGKYARVAAIVATDIGAVAATGGCIVGAAALTAVTAGGGGGGAGGGEVGVGAAEGRVAPQSSASPFHEHLAARPPPPTAGRKAP